MGATCEGQTAVRRFFLALSSFWVWHFSGVGVKEKKGKVVTVEGKIDGKISKTILGKKGFGYDPIFIPMGMRVTFGQMSKKKKIHMDHRFLAFQKLKKKIKI